jgi:hypothetical protein
MKYDDASWHYGGNFPKDLPESAGATHIAMFVSWAVLNDLAGDIHKSDFSDDLAKLRQRESTPGGWFLSICDGKFTDEDLNEAGNAFASSYYGNEDGLHTVVGSYLADYDQAFLKKRPLFSKRKTLYHVPDTWQTFSVISAILEASYANWQNHS